jgi:mono/diheme cytochrome c family protein
MGGIVMKYRSASLLFFLAMGAQAASAQTALSPQQIHGRQIVTQNCVVCHMPSDPGAKTYGPPLNKAAANGDDMLMHEVIQNGLVLMPGWKYTLSSSDIDDVVAFLKTVPVSAAPASR